MTYETSCCSISNDLSLIATGTIGGVIRLYDFQSKLCVSKFSVENEKQEQHGHNSKVTDVHFVNKKKGVLASCSLDGCVRVYDTIRLKCFRVMQPELPNQLSCIDSDPSGDLICVGGFDPYEIYVFSL